MDVCLSCKKVFPDHLLSSNVCPICALEHRNSVHGLPPETPFQGEMADAMHREAVAYLKKRENR